MDELKAKYEQLSKEYLDKKYEYDNKLTEEKYKSVERISNSISNFTSEMIEDKNQNKKSLKLFFKKFLPLSLASLPIAIGFATLISSPATSAFGLLLLKSIKAYAIVASAAFMGIHALPCACRTFFSIIPLKKNIEKYKQMRSEKLKNFRSKELDEELDNLNILKGEVQFLKNKKNTYSEEQNKCFEDVILEEYDEFKKNDEEVTLKLKRRNK